MVAFVHRGLTLVTGLQNAPIWLRMCLCATQFLANRLLLRKIELAYKDKLGRIWIRFTFILVFQFLVSNKKFAGRRRSWGVHLVNLWETVEALVGGSLTSTRSRHLGKSSNQRWPRPIPLIYKSTDFLPQLNTTLWGNAWQMNFFCCHFVFNFTTYGIYEMSNSIAVQGTDWSRQCQRIDAQKSTPIPNGSNWGGWQQYLLFLSL